VEGAAAPPRNGPTVADVGPKTPATPALAPLARARARQQTALRWLHPLMLAVGATVVIASSATRPRPGLHGDRLGILLALTGFTIGLLALFGFTSDRVGPIRTSDASTAVKAPLFALLIASSSVLVWLQPSGPGFLGVFVAVSAAAMGLPGRPSVITVAGAAVSLAAAEVAAAGPTATSIITSELGVVAFYLLAVLANRLREGQSQAEQLLIQLEQTRAAQAQAAAMAERHRLAREMHDVLAHSLSALVLQLEGARLLVSGPDAGAQLAAAVDGAHHLAKSGLAEASQAIGMLRDEELPGPERLDALARDFERDTGVRCELTVTGGEREPGSQARLTLYRVAQEALTNIRKHAHPQRVEVRLCYEPTGTRLSIEDAGEPAAPPPPAGHGGYGLTGMRERAELLGGTLLAAPTASGFRVELWVPK
jgi:signal transduction histidine kinase